MSALVDGARFVLDTPPIVPAVWGEGDDVLWAMGEPLVLAGPAGVGKSTLAQRLALARAGVSRRLEVLDLLVTPDPDRRVLYVAADRPRQVARSMRRMVGEGDRARLADYLMFWSGPVPFELCREPERLAAWAVEHKAGTVVLDSLYNVAGDLADGTVGQAVARALSACVAAGVEVVALHHPRKAQQDNTRPRKLDDLYGSTWIGAAAGSVVFLYGQAGDPVVELLHLKQPAAEVGPLRVEHDSVTGNLRRVGGRELPDLLAAAGDEGVTVKDATASLYGEASRANLQRARRRLGKLIEAGEAVSRDVEGVTRWFCVPPRAASRAHGTNGHDEARNGSDTGHAPGTDGHAPRALEDSPPTGGSVPPCVPPSTVSTFGPDFWSKPRITADELDERAAALAAWKGGAA